MVELTEEERERVALLQWQAFTDEFLLAVAESVSGEGEEGEEAAGEWEERGEIEGRGWDDWSNVEKWRRCREVLLRCDAPYVESQVGVLFGVAIGVPIGIAVGVVIGVANM